MEVLLGNGHAPLGGFVGEEKPPGNETGAPPLGRVGQIQDLGVEKLPPPAGGAQDRKGDPKPVGEAVRRVSAGGLF